MTSGLSVVVPAYDDAEHLAASLRRLGACLEATGRAFEGIVVDDGSRDATHAQTREAALRGIGAEIADVRTLASNGSAGG